MGLKVGCLAGFFHHCTYDDHECIYTCVSLSFVWKSSWNWTKTGLWTITLCRKEVSCSAGFFHHTVDDYECIYACMHITISLVWKCETKRFVNDCFM